MLKLIPGRSGSGKTEYLRTLLKEKALNGDSRLIIIVPEQYSFDTERAILEMCGPGAAAGIEVLSFTRLSDYVFRSLGGNAGETADEATKLILMMRAMDASRDRLEQYGKHVDSVPLARQMLSAIQEFKDAGIKSEDLKFVSGSISAAKPVFSERLSELATIYEFYSSLFDNRFKDQAMKTEKLIKTLAENDIFDGYTIAIDGFKGFTGQEFKIIEQLLKSADDVYVSVCTNDIHTGDASMLWDSVIFTVKKLEALAKKADVQIIDMSRKDKDYPVKPGLRFRNEDLKTVEENFLNPAAEHKEGSFDNVSMFAALNIYDECRFIAATIRKLLREDGFRCKDIAIIVRDEEQYRRELQSAFRRYEIPFFEDSRQPVYSQPVICFARIVLELISSGGFTSDNLLQYIKTGLSPLTDTEAASLESYIYLWGIKGSALSTPFTENPAGLGAENNEKSEKELAELNEIRAKAVGPVLKLKSTVSSANFEEISKALYEFIVSSKVPEKLKKLANIYNDNGFVSLANEQNRVYDLLMEILDKMAENYGTAVTPVEKYRDIFNAVVSVADLGSIPDGLDNVRFGQADRIRLSSPRVVFVAGAAEGSFPAVLGNSGLLSQTDRQILLDNGIELSLPDTLKASEERFIAYKAISAPCEKLYVSYHRIGSGNEANSPSEIIESIRKITGRNPVDTDTLPKEYFVESSASSFNEYASLIRSADEDEQSLKLAIFSVLSEKNLYKDRLETINSVVENKPFSIASGEIATGLFGKEMYLSASRVDNFYHCPFQYFCRYGLGLRPRKAAELDPAQTGTTIHHVLEQLLKLKTIDDYIAMDEAARHEAIDTIIDDYLEEKLGGRSGKTNRFLYVFNNMKLTLYDILDRLCDEFSMSLFRPVDMELGIGDKGGNEEPISTYELDLPDGGKLRLHGSVDRVDTYTDEEGKTFIKIVDYKTGGKKFSLNDVLCGINLQMLLYLFAIQKGGKDYYGDNLVPAGIYYYQAKKSTINYSGRGNGLFLDDEKILNAMEDGLGGKYLPITYKKDGSFKEADFLLTAEQLGKLNHKLDTIIIDMAEELHKGTIPALPYGNNEQTQPCKFCDYRAVCKREDGDARQVPDFSKADVLKALESEDNNFFGGETSGRNEMDS